MCEAVLLLLKPRLLDHQAFTIQTYDKLQHAVMLIQAEPINGALTPFRSCSGEQPKYQCKVYYTLNTGNSGASGFTAEALQQGTRMTAI
jgi:hypothetical protein